MHVYAGIDEAGYGPLLGPLCVGLASFEFDKPLDPSCPPDLWAMCPDIFCRRPRDAGTSKIAIEDSKALKLSNQTVSKDPLIHLERGVLSCLRSIGDVSLADDAQLMASLGVRTSAPPWYKGEATSLPLGTSDEHIGLLGARTATVLERSGARVAALRCACVDERVFNRLLGESGSKAAVTLCAIARLVRGLANAYADQPDVELHIAIDRQGGRSSYSDALSACFDSCAVSEVERELDVSAYKVEFADRVPAYVRFQKRAEGSHLPVALASMTAKLVRELMMRRFNKYFALRMPELKPTAGYVTDARRWLSDARAVLSDDERAELVRRA